MSDLLRMDYINSLPQPFMVRFCGDKGWWLVEDIDVKTGLMRIDVYGKLDVKHFREVAQIKSLDGPEHNPDDWYNEEALDERL